MGDSRRGDPTGPETADREIAITRYIDAPRELVFRAFTEVKHLARWWGPEGFTTTTRSFEFREGGVWDFVMHGPDGTDYQEWITWREIVPPERIALLHGESAEDPEAFESVLDFQPDGGGTRVEFRTVFPTRELRDRAAQEYHAVEGGEQTLANLAAHVAELADAQGEAGVRRQLVRVHNFSVSLDGFGTGEGQCLEAPFGHAGHRLLEWALPTRTFQDMGFHGDREASVGVDEAFASRWNTGIGAEIMGRNKFSPTRGPWADETWRGWWGDTPPFHTPVIVLTHHPRPTLELDGGTTFHFMDAEPAAALDAARELAGGLDVRIGGGASTIRQFLRADLIDQMHIVVVPVILGRGERLWDGVEGLEERFHIESTTSPSGVTHLSFWRRRTPGPRTTSGV
ncbi:SRPBCC domain-containing protein [Dietzia sp. B19]|uniref:SRPBCC domain-containing protein n=1 Tax=Dietzia sp. B19 TaxID=1630632 RepID=UPI00321FF753